MSLVTLRPTGQTKIVSVGVTGAGTLNGATSDDSDSSYIAGTQDLAYCWLEIGTTTLAGNQRVKTARVDIRCAANAGGDNESAQARLRDPVSGKTAAAHVRTRGFTSPVSTFEGPESSGYPGGIPWIQERLDRVQLEVFWYASAGNQFLRVHELYVVLDVNTQPVVSGLAVTGTGTTRPSIGFGYSDTEGDPQTAVVAKVFSAAQYGAAGFDAETSKATWSSGTLRSDADSIQVGKDLANGATYKFYVKAGQSWAGPEGDLWYSDWVASSAFTVGATQPPTPALTVSQDLALPGYRTRLTVVAPLNLATANQASLETDTAGWTALSNCTISRSTAQAADGVASLQMSSSAAGTMTAEMSTRSRVKPGQPYSATASVRSAAAARTVRAGLRFYDAAGALIGTTNFGGTAASTTTGWTAVSVTGQTAPAGAYTASVVVEVQATAAAAEIHRWDKIGYQVGSSPSWTPGDWDVAASVIVERLDKVTADRGVATNWLHPQIASAGGLTLGVDGFYARQSSYLASVPIDTAHPAGPTGGAGARMILWRPLIGAGNALDIGLPLGATDDPEPPYLTAAVPGRAMTFSAWLKGSAAVGARLVAVSVDQTNAGITTATGSTAALSTSAWTRYTVTVTPGAGSGYLRMRVELPSSDADVDVMLTGLQVELGSSVTAWQPGRGVLDPEWVEVRAIDTRTPVFPGETYTVWDHEAAPGRPVLYRARTEVGDPVDTATDDTAPIAVYMDPPADDLLKDPYRPENAVVITVNDYSRDTAEDVQEFHGLGRDGDPVFWRDWVGRTGQVVLVSRNAADQYRLDQLIPSPRPLLLQWASGGQTYLRLVTRGQAPLFDAAGLWRSTLGYAEKERP